MATPDTRFDALGKTWSFKFGVGAICRLEQSQGGKPFGDIVNEMLPGLTFFDLEDPAKLAAALPRMRFSLLLALVAAGLDETEAVAADIIDDLGLDKALGVIFAAAGNDLGTGRQGAKKGAARPRKKPSA